MTPFPHPAGKGLAENRDRCEHRRTMSPARSGSPSLFDLADRPDYALEQALARQGFLAVAGLDEAGRGPLAGPVAAAAVILDPDDIPPGLDDSKRLGAKAREAAFGAIMAKARSVAFATSSAQTIDQTDIRKASLDAMRRAVTALAVQPDFTLADGRDVPPGLIVPGRAVIKGDQRSLSIAAASIVAKVMRDRMMEIAGGQWPQYGFESHKGYGAAAHMAAIGEHGPVPGLHRMSFAPLRTNENAARESGA